MTIGDLKEMIHALPDDMQVLIPMNAGEGFDGAWFSPCIEESGEATLGIDEDEENGETDEAFCIVPCGFFEPHEGVPPELN
jgi:hypothetical protein